MLLTGCQSYKIENGKWSFVQWNEGEGRSVREVQGADQSSFVPINDEYAKDNKHVFLETQVIQGADPKAFVHLGEHYGKDKQKVFFNGKEIIGADPNTFQNTHGSWSKDVNDFYYGEHPLKVLDLTSFTHINDGWGWGGGWAKDKLAYYVAGAYIGKVDCDYSTMKIFNGYAVDKNRGYWEGIPIEGVDVNTFQEVSEVSAKDRYRDYLLERPRANFYNNNVPLKSLP
jgi:hypothetical protein